MCCNWLPRCEELAGQVPERRELDALYSNWIPGCEEVASQVPEGRELDEPDQLTRLLLQLFRQPVQATPVRPPRLPVYS